MSMWLSVLLVLQLLLIVGLFIYFIQSESWDEEIKYSVLEEEADDPEVLPNPYRKVWQDYLSSR